MQSRLPSVHITALAHNYKQGNGSFNLDTDGVPFIIDNSATGAICTVRSLFVGPFQQINLSVGTAHGIKSSIKHKGTFRLILTDNGGKDHSYDVPDTPSTILTLHTPSWESHSSQPILANTTAQKIGLMVAPGSNLLPPTHNSSGMERSMREILIMATLFCQNSGCTKEHPISLLSAIGQDITSMTKLNMHFPQPSSCHPT